MSAEETPSRRRTRPANAPWSLPYLPLLHAIWVQAEASPADAEELVALVRTMEALGDEERTFLEAWLDPTDPPDPAELADLVRTVRGARLDEDCATSLTDVGLALLGATEPTARSTTNPIWRLGFVTSNRRWASCRRRAPVEPSVSPTRPGPSEKSARPRSPALTETTIRGLPRTGPRGATGRSDGAALRPGPSDSLGTDPPRVPRPGARGDPVPCGPRVEQPGLPNRVRWLGGSSRRRGNLRSRWPSAT